VLVGEGGKLLFYFGGVISFVKRRRFTEDCCCLDAVMGEKRARLMTVGLERELSTLGDEFGGACMLL
jgi:hypothetical protein